MLETYLILMTLAMGLLLVWGALKIAQAFCGVNACETDGFSDEEIDDAQALLVVDGVPPQPPSQSGVNTAPKIPLDTM